MRDLQRKLVGADISTLSSDVTFNGAADLTVHAFFDDGLRFFAEGPPVPSMLVAPPSFPPDDTGQYDVAEHV